MLGEDRIYDLRHDGVVVSDEPGQHRFARAQLRGEVRAQLRLDGARLVAGLDELAKRAGAFHVPHLSPRASGFGGRTFTRLTLPGGRQPLGPGFLAVLNRVRYLPAARFHTASARDRDYASAELQALVASWLGSLGELVVQPVRTHPWVTPWLSRLRWVSAAVAAGLPLAEERLTCPPPASLPVATGVEPAEEGHVCTVLVAGGVVRGALADRYGEECLAAACAMGFPLLEFRFALRGDGPCLVHVDPLPELRDAWAAAMVADHLRALAAGQA